MLNTININLKTDIKTDRPTTLPIKLMSQDKNNNQFILRFTNGGESVTLDDSYNVEILTNFSKSGTSRLTTAKVRQDYATWEFDTAYITQDETVYNYVYVRKSGNLVVSADANCFVFSVDLSEIDKGAGKVAETYDENYQKHLDEFKDNVDFEEIAQAEQARKDAEILRQESYEQKVDTAIAEADVVEKVDNKVTELTPQISNLTAQLAQKAELKIFENVPLSSDLGLNELGLVLIPLFPFDYSFNGTNSTLWDKYRFSTSIYEKSAGLLNQSESFAKIRENAGHIRVTKGSNVGICTVENKALIDLDFTNDKKYRINFDVKNLGLQGTNKGNVGITISGDESASYYPVLNPLVNGYSFYLTVIGELLHGKVRKFVGGTMSVDEYVATNGGYAADSSERLSLGIGEFINISLEISTTSSLLKIDGEEYLNISESLSILNSNNIKLVLWGMNNDANSTVIDHYFNNLLIEEVI